MDTMTTRLRSVLGRAEGLDERALAEVGLPVRHFALLELLAAKELTVTGLAALDKVYDRTTTATLVRRLDDRGLVRRTPMPGNNRVLVLELTPEGAAMLAAAARRLADCERRLLAPLAPDERVLLRRALDRLVEVAP